MTATSDPATQGRRRLVRETPTGTATPRPDLRGRSLLAVFAHPDDESIACGGLLAWCARLGADLALLCLTRGEHGRGGADDLARTRQQELARTRQRELEAAARVLGIGSTTLLDHEDGMLPWLDAARLRSDIGAAIRRHRPEVVVTFDEDGLYGHPDHRAVHARTTEAVAALGDRAPALYYVTMPPGAMRAVADHAARAFDAADRRSPAGAARDEDRPATIGASRDAARRAPPASILGVDDPDAFGAEAPRATLVLDAGTVAAAKLAALACHATQFRGGALEAIAPADAPRLLGVEHYRRARRRRAGRCLSRRPRHRRGRGHIANGVTPDAESTRSGTSTAPAGERSGPT